MVLVKLLLDIFLFCNTCQKLENVQASDGLRHLLNIGLCFSVYLHLYPCYGLFFFYCKHTEVVNTLSVNSP